MARTSLQPFTVFVGGDAYLSNLQVRLLRDQALKARPETEVMELDASEIDQYAFDEAVSPSLLSDTAIVIIRNLQGSDERLVDSMVRFCREAKKEPQDNSIVIAQFEGQKKKKEILKPLEQAGAVSEEIPDLKTDQAKLNFTLGCFEQLGRRVAPDAAQQLVAVLGNSTGELAAMCSQLCFDFDDDPISLDRVDQYLTSNPQVTSFAVADKALAGNTSQAIIAMRSAVEQGVSPIALIGALAMKLRNVAKAAAVQSGALTENEAKMAPWMMRIATRQLRGWTSEGLSLCFQTLAWADEQCKSNGGDPVYALERSIEFITHKGKGM
ncbi:DNA polymerase III subunit delta [Bifidobacterium tsurumiense]|nr:DNA polymerase III subunit delta [Bifidobacterium tsurumiense]MDY4677463.1 DNA polymerase III subunit delta [Bifidobacterium tsurumiense]MSS11892.1 DNA polymerase III subunit delta [Bifidobacterium tsurumiense]